MYVEGFFGWKMKKKIILFSLFSIPFKHFLFLYHVLLASFIMKKRIHIILHENCSYNSGTFLLFLACTVIWVLDPAKYTTYIYNTTTVFSHCVGLRHVKHPITIESVVRIPPKQRGSTCLVKQVLSILTLLRKRWRTQTGPRPSWAKSPKINTF